MRGFREALTARAELLSRFRAEPRNSATVNCSVNWVEDAELALRSRIVHGQLHARSVFPDVEKATRLAALAVDGQGCPITACTQNVHSAVPKTSS